MKKQTEQSVKSVEKRIRTYHEKVDHLLLDQWSKMMRIQEMQIEILEELRTKLDK